MTVRGAGLSRGYGPSGVGPSRRGDPGVDWRGAAYVLWCSIVANNMMAAASGMLPTDGLALVWKVHLHGIVSPKSAGYFEQFVQRVAALHAQKGPPSTQSH